MYQPQQTLGSHPCLRRAAVLTLHLPFIELKTQLRTVRPAFWTLRSGPADVLDGVVGQAEAPFLDGHGVEMARLFLLAGELQAHGIGTDRLATMTNAVQAGVTQLDDQLRRQGREGVLAQMLDQRFGFTALVFLALHKHYGASWPRK